MNNAELTGRQVSFLLEDGSEMVFSVVSVSGTEERLAVLEEENTRSLLVTRITEADGDISFEPVRDEQRVNAALEAYAAESVLGMLDTDGEQTEE